MKFFKLYDRIINADLRPHNFDPDGKSISLIAEKFRSSSKYFYEYLRYLDKKGREYKATIKDSKTGKTLFSVENDDVKFNELIDLDIPPYPDNKGKEYVDLLEFEACYSGY